MVGGKLENLVHIANRRIDILNSRIDTHGSEMYAVPDEPTPEYVRMMVGDLDWLMESIEPTVGRDDPAFKKYVDVRERLAQIHNHLETKNATA